MSAKISVIIPIYNSTKTLKRSLDSLASQDFSDFEVVITDDGSTDCPQALLSNIDGGMNIRYERYEHSGNVALMRNRGLAVAQGQYIAVLDSDDWCCKERLGLQSKYLDENADVDILGSWVTIVEERKVQDARHTEKLFNAERTRDEIIDECLNGECCICHSSIMMRREALEVLGGYDEALGICADYDLWLRALSRGMQIRVMPMKAVYRTVHDGSVSSVYAGSDKAIRNIVCMKLRYVLQAAKSANRTMKNVAVWGRCKRDEIALPCIMEAFAVYGMERPHITVIDAHGKLSEDIAADYSFVTTLSQKERVFQHLDAMHKKRVTDYIYL